jgi:prevent-host-death family protein
MSTEARKGVEEARNQLPKLIEAAEAGHATVITRHGRAVAALVPLGEYGAPPRQQSLLSIAATGRGLWGRKSGRTISGLRDEWSR